ncbi:MAG: DUF799 domain-containing protein [Duncaniella dubosii]|nr:DUF799 domain-containing protein [Duncaniella dubosii]
MKKYIVALAVAMSLASCSVNTITRGEQYSKIYEESPKTIVVMPPINETNFTEAKDYFYTTMYIPLCEKGYYVFSPFMVMEMFQEEGAYDSEMFLTSNLSQFRNVLGCDAVMFTKIKTWEKKALNGQIKVGVEYILRSAKTAETLYQREGLITLDTSVSGGTSGLGALISLAATALNTATTEKIDAGHRCTQFVLRDMPEGFYSPNFNKDQKLPAEEKFVKATVR